MNRLVRISCVLALLAACGKKKPEGNDKPAVTPATTTSGSAAGATTGPGAAGVKQDLPPAPADTRKGDSRVVNLLVDEAGKPVTVDVWGKRSFEWGPEQFAKGLAYGQVTPHFAIPKGMSTVVVTAGADAQDRKQEVGSVWASQDAEEVTTVLYRDDGQNRSIVMGMKPEGLHNAPAAPPAGKGLLYIAAGPLRTHEAKLAAKFEGSSFRVGDGSTNCLRQRLEDKGQQAMILGGTNATVHDVAPGKVKFTLHNWLGKDCSTPALAEFEVEVADGKGTFVILHSPDAGGSIQALQIPMWK